MTWNGGRKPFGRLIRFSAKSSLLKLEIQSFFKSSPHLFISMTHDICLVNLLINTWYARPKSGVLALLSRSFQPTRSLGPAQQPKSADFCVAVLEVATTKFEGLESRRRFKVLILEVSRRDTIEKLAWPNHSPYGKVQVSQHGSSTGLHAGQARKQQCQLLYPLFYWFMEGRRRKQYGISQTRSIRHSSKYKSSHIHFLSQAFACRLFGGEGQKWQSFV